MILIQGQSHIDMIKNVEFNTVYHHTKFEPFRFMKVRMHDNVEVVVVGLLFFDAVSETAVIPLVSVDLI